jgi:hypothetical protein
MDINEFESGYDPNAMYGRSVEGKVIEVWGLKELEL